MCIEIDVNSKYIFTLENMYLNIKNADISIPTGTKSC